MRSCLTAIGEGIGKAYSSSLRLRGIERDEGVDVQGRNTQDEAFCHLILGGSAALTLGPLGGLNETNLVLYRGGSYLLTPKDQIKCKDRYKSDSHPVAMFLHLAPLLSFGIQ
jgi:hypothetical protein